MATNLADITDLAETPSFRNRVRAAANENGPKVIETTGTDDYSVETQNARALYGRLVLNPDRYVPAFCYAVAARPEITAESDDDAIRAAIDTVWDHVAFAFF